jgi:hypothetical protein
MATGVSSSGVDAQTFLKVLSLIDRTILPRRLLLTNGSARLALVVARQRASLADAKGGIRQCTEETLASMITRLCIAGAQMAYRLEPISPAPPADAGFAAMTLVNAQDMSEAPDDSLDVNHYRFSKTGWPLAAPAQASVASLEAAARLAWAMAGWQGRHGDKLKSQTLILAISEALPHDLSVSVAGDVTITSTPPAMLGRLVSRWRNRSSDQAGEPE